MIISNEDFAIIQKSNQYISKEEFIKYPELLFLSVLKSYWIEEHVNNPKYRIAFSKYIKALNEHGFFDDEKQIKMIFDVLFSLIKSELTIYDYNLVISLYLFEYKHFFLGKKNALPLFIFDELKKYKIGKKIEKSLIKKVKEELLPEKDSEDMIVNEFESYYEDHIAFWYDGKTESHILLSKLFYDVNPKDVQYIYYDSDSVGSTLFISRNKEHFCHLKEKLLNSHNKSFFFSFYKKMDLDEFQVIRDIIKEKHLDIYQLFIVNDKDSNNDYDKVLFKPLKEYAFKFIEFSNFLMFLFNEHHDVYSDLLESIFNAVLKEQTYEMNGLFLLNY